MISGSSTVSWGVLRRARWASHRLSGLPSPPESPQTAAKIANAIEETYIVAQIEIEVRGNSPGQQLAGVRVAELRAEVESKERAIEEFRGRSGLIIGKDVTVATQQMSELASQLVRRGSRFSSAESSCRQVERLMDSPRRRGGRARGVGIRVDPGPAGARRLSSGVNWRS